MKGPRLASLLALLLGLLTLGVATPLLAGFVVDFRQGANQNPNLGQEVWINGILNPSNSQFYEGMVVAQRLIMTGIPATTGNVHQLAFRVDATKAGIHAYDFLASWEQVVATANAFDPYFKTVPMTMAGLNPCGPAIGPPNTLAAVCAALYGGANHVQVAAPNDPFVSKDGATQDKIAGFVALFGQRLLTLYGNHPITNATLALVSHTASGGSPIASGGDTGDSTVHYVLSWTSSSDQILFTFGTHLSVSGSNQQGENWGPGLGAAYISGGSYHASLDTLDAGTPTSITLGSQDNQIQSNAVALPPPSCGVSGPDSACAGASGLTYTATTDGSPVTYSWSVSGNGTISGSTTGSSVVVNAGSSGTFNVQVAITGVGGTSTCSKSVTVNANPAPIAANGGAVCAGGTVTLSATAGFASYSWSGPNGFTSALQNPSIASATTAASGTYGVTVTDANGCVGSASTTVTVNSNPTPSAGNTGPYCVGATISLSASGGTSYSWSGPNGFTSALQNPTISGATLANAGTYTVTVTNASGCTAQATTNVAVNALPSPTAGNDGPYCAGATVHLSASGGTSYSWKGPNGFTSTDQNPTISDATTAATGTYTVTVTNEGGCTKTAETTVTVNALPDARAANGGPYCAGATIALTASGGTSYSWTGPNFTSSEQNPTIPNAAAANAGTYTVTVTNASGCTKQATTTVVVNPLPKAEAGNDGPYCAGATIHLSASGGASYSWTGPNFASNEQNPMIPNATTAMAGEYKVTVTTEHGCTAEASTTVVVNALPEAAAANGGPYCAGATISLTSSGGGTYAWTGPDGFTSSDQNPTILSAAAANAGTYTVTVTNASGCTKQATTTVVVNPLPEAKAGNDGPYCAGSTIALSASGGGTYAWTGPNGFTSTDQNPTILNATTAMAGEYKVTVTSEHGCTAQASTTVVVHALPTPTAGSTGPYCAGSTISLTASGGVSYSWSGPNSFASTLQNPTIPNATTADDGTYTVTVTDANGCKASTTTTVVVHANPVPVATNSGPVCAGGAVNFTSTPDNATYSWTGPNGFTSALQKPSIAAASAAAAGEYTVTVTDANGCTGTAKTTLVVYDNPVPVADNSGPVCTGSSVSLKATGGFASYSWTGPAGFTSLDQNPSIANATTGASGTYSLTVTDAHGCTGTASTTVTINAEPTPVAGNSGPYCVGGTINLTATGGYASYSWTGPEGFTSTDQNPSIANATTAMSGTYTVTVTDSNGCTGSSSTTVTVNICLEFCTVTPGFWGSASGGQGKFDNVTAFDLLTCLLSGNPLTIGVVGTRSLTITDASCIISRFPSSGTPTDLPDFGKTGSRDRTIAGTNCNTTNPAIPLSNNGRFKNILLGETATLILNVRMNGYLAGYVLPATITTVPPNPGPNGTVGEPLDCVPSLLPNDDSANFGNGCNTITRKIPAGLVGMTVAQLIDIANNTLAGNSTGFSASQVNQAVTAVNEGFDKCRFLGSCPLAPLGAAELLGSDQ